MSTPRPKWERQALDQLADRLEKGPHLGHGADPDYWEKSRLWRETWILPLLRAVAAGDRLMAEFHLR